MWKTWKRGFDLWESTTAEFLEKVVTNPAVLEPAGLFLTAAMKTKAAQEKAMAAGWSAVGLPTRVDQERQMHALNQMQSRLMDLEEELEMLREAAGPER